MRRNGRVDGNHPEIVKALRQAGMSVAITSGLGGGFPDLVVGWRGVNVLLEVKDGTKPPSARALTADEKDWHAKWGGQISVVESPQGAVDAVIAGWGRSNG